MYYVAFDPDFHGGPARHRAMRACGAKECHRQVLAQQQANIEAVALKARDKHAREKHTNNSLLRANEKRNAGAHDDNARRTR
eukprot:624617-Pyramimonas_sp.AAC.1